MGLANSEWNAAFRAIYRKPLVYFLEHRKEIFTTSDGQYGSKCDIKEVFASDDYKSIYNLVIILSFSKQYSGIGAAKGLNTETIGIARSQIDDSTC